LIKEQHKEDIEAKFTKEELNYILQSFKKAKSLGSYGWTTKFYLWFYEFLKEKLLIVIEDSKAQGKYLGALNVIFIAQF
jgi:hypothetical protein